jgi:hypothetical protein
VRHCLSLLNYCAWATAFSLTGVPAAQAQQVPTEVVRSAFAALRDSDWAAFATLMDPDEQKQFRDQQLAVLTAWAQRRPAPVAQNSMSSLSAGSTPDPAAVSRFSDTHVPAFRGSPTLGQIATMAPRAFVIEWLAAAYSGPLGLHSFSFGGPRSARRVILGAVIEGDSLAHVVYRADGIVRRYPWQVSVLSLKRQPGGDWFLLIRHELALGPGMLNLLFHAPGETSGGP